MKRYFGIISLLLIVFLTKEVVIAQALQRTIKVTGSSQYNLSPNEIIIQIDFQEYFPDEMEETENKVTLDVIEKKLLQSILKSGVEKDKITVGGVRMVRPYKGNVQLKRRLNKTIFVCVTNSDQYIKLTRSLESDNLFDESITQFDISQFKNTEKEMYLTKSRSEAYKNAVEKATLILSESGQKLGKVIQVNELNTSSSNRSSLEFYSFDNAAEDISGFQPIVISYQLEVIFAIE